MCGSSIVFEGEMLMLFGWEVEVIIWVVVWVVVVIVGGGRVDVVEL